MFNRILSFFKPKPPVKTLQEEIQEELDKQIDNLKNAKIAVEQSADLIRATQLELDTLTADLNILKDSGDEQKINKKSNEVEEKRKELNDLKQSHNTHYEKIEQFGDDIEAVKHYASTMKVTLNLTKANLESQKGNDNIASIKERMNFELNKTKAEIELRNELKVD